MIGRYSLRPPKGEGRKLSSAGAVTDWPFACPTAPSVSVAGCGLLVSSALARNAPPSAANRRVAKTVQKIAFTEPPSTIRWVPHHAWGEAAGKARGNRDVPAGPGNRLQWLLKRTFSIPGL